MWGTALLIAVVTLSACGMAYINDARLKVVLYSLPLPMTVSTVVSGLPFEATHTVGLFILWGFIWLCWLLHSVWRIGIMATLGVMLGLYLPAALLAVRILPLRGESGEASLWYAMVVFQVVLAAALLKLLPERSDPGHRSSLPVALKFLLILVIVTSVVLSRDHLRGFVVTFPYVTLFAIYECRHSLYTFAWRNSLYMLAIMPSITAFRILYPVHASLEWALAGMWCVYIPLYLAMNRRVLFSWAGTAK